MKFEPEGPIQNHHPKLYTKDSIGNLREWRIEQNGEKYRTYSGIHGGQIVISEWTTALPKNEGKANATTGEKQATSEVLAKYKKQRKTGYYDHIHEVDNESKYVSPMLAKKLKDRENKVTFPAMLDRKYNGGRIVATKNGCHSRQGEEWLTVPHIFESLKPLFDKYPNLVCDGEGYNHEYRFKLNELMSILRKSKNITNEDLKKSKEIVKYYIYDCYGFDDIIEETGCEDRRKAAKKLFEGINSVVVVDYEIVNSLTELYVKYQSYVNDGYEGAMYRTINAPYSHNRSSDLLKVKPEDSTEAVITQIHEGEGNWSKTAKTCTVNWNGRFMDPVFKGSQEELKDILNNQEKWLGKKVTVLYNGLTGLGLLNFPRIDVNNCFKR